MKYIVIEAHKTKYKNPINVHKNEKIKFTNKIDEEYKDWLYCIKMDGSNSGWIPKKIIKKENNFGTITEDYSAKELNVEKEYNVEG
jgi:hypothetical protein